MILRIVLPERELLATETTRVVAQGVNGSFCMLPRHRDIVNLLVPSILSFTTEEGEKYAAIDEGLLVKCGAEVTVATKQTVLDHPLGELRNAVRDRFLALSEAERQARNALGKLEADLVRQVLSWEHR